MTAGSVSTRQLFRAATEIVREWPLDPADRKPAFSLTRPAPAPVQASPGPVLGAPGDWWDTAARIRNGDIEVAEVAARAAERARLFDHVFGAFEFREDTKSLAQELAEEVRSGALRGPLHGMPLSVKDIIDVEAMPTRGSSAALPARTATRDATAVARLRAAGALIVGKATTHEFALGVTTPQSLSPWDKLRVPGGSSGGSAISLVTGMAMGSLGTDTRASIRVPAALCGLVGFKPSLELVPTDRWITLSWTLDHFAPMARSVRDVALMLDVLTGAPGRFSGLLPGTLAGVRVGWTSATLTGAQPAVVSCFHEALQAMAQAGAIVLELDGPTAEDFALANAAGMVVSRSEAAHFHQEAGTNFDLCIPEVRDQLTEASGVPATDYIRGLRLRGQVRDRMVSAMSAVDILAMPTCKVTAPLRTEADDYLLVLSENCIPWSFVDFPAVSVHMGMADGMPCGIQLVAGPGQDPRLLSAAYAVERTMPPAPEWRPE